MTLPRTAIGPYRLLRKLGEGGMGAVYEGLHEAIERQVAIKILHPEYARDASITQRFFNEARATNRIAHPSLVQVSDYGQLSDGTTYIVMEFLNGETLGRRLQQRGGRLPLPEALYISWQIAAALTVAHDKGIIHRDLKPENIMLVPDPLVAGGERAKLLDFGIAKLAQDPKVAQARTRSDLIMGTPTYMSPEQCRGAGMVDAKADVYSLGVMIYQMLAGRPPFIGDGSGALIGMHLFKEPPPLSEQAPKAPGALVVLVHSLLEKERDKRPSMRQVAAKLARLQAQHGAAPAQAAPSSPAQMTSGEQPTALPTHHSTLGGFTGQRRRLPPLRRRRLILAALIGASVAAVVAWSLHQARKVQTHAASRPAASSTITRPDSLAETPAANRQEGAQAVLPQPAAPLPAKPLPGASSHPVSTGSSPRPSHLPVTSKPQPSGKSTHAPAKPQFKYAE